MFNNLKLSNSKKTIRRVALSSLLLLTTSCNSWWGGSDSSSWSSWDDSSWNSWWTDVINTSSYIKATVQFSSSLSNSVISK